MSYHKLEPGDKDFLEECPFCENGYMVPTYGDWYQCSECGVEGQLSDGGCLMFDESLFDDPF